MKVILNMIYVKNLIILMIDHATLQWNINKAVPSSY
mgnify:FL=1